MSLIVLAFTVDTMANIPVFDAASFGNAVKSFMQLQTQLEQLQQTHKQLENTYAQLAKTHEKITDTHQSLTGSRGISSLFNDPALRHYLPAEWHDVYNQLSGEVSNSADAIRSAEKLKGSVDEMEQQIREREIKKAAYDKAVGMESFKMTSERLARLDKLANKISTTKDMKEIEELQAGLAIEQAAVQNEHTKVQLISMLQQAEERLIMQQKTELSRKILSSKNTGFPKI